jgi:hypothetical protein
VLSNVLLRDAEARANFSGAAVNGNPMGGASAVRRFASDQIPTSANRFAGTNRGQFTNGAWDELGSSLRTALDDDRRLQLERDMLRVFTTELPALPFQYELQGIPVAGFKGSWVSRARRIPATSCTQRMRTSGRCGRRPALGPRRPYQRSCSSTSIRISIFSPTLGSTGLPTMP